MAYDYGRINVIIDYYFFFMCVFKVIGGVHGNEAVTTEMTLQLMQLLLSHHELDDAISRVMKGYR